MLKKRLGLRNKFMKRISKYKKCVSSNLKNKKLVSWEPTHLLSISNNHFQWNKKYINIFTYSINSWKVLRSRVLSIPEISDTMNPRSLKESILRLKSLGNVEKERINLEGERRTSSINELHLIKINSPISNTKILTKILNKNKFGIIKSIERVNELVNSHSDEFNLSKLGTLSNSLNKTDLNWYDLINIKRIKTSMTGIKLDIHGRLTKRKKASRAKKYRYLKGKLCLNSFSSLIDKSRTVTSLINGSVGIKMITRSVIIYRTI